MTAELQVVKDEKQNLLARVSQEQANVIALNDKFTAMEKLRQVAEKKNEELSKELTILQEKYSEEANNLRANVAEKEMLVKDIREESVRLREIEVEKATNDKLTAMEKLRQVAEKKNEELSKELTILQEKYSEEANNLRANVAEKELLVKDIREESARLREIEVEKALNQERERANARLDGILNELTKSNQNISTLTADLENKDSN